MTTPSLKLSRNQVYHNQAQLDEHKIESGNENRKIFVCLRGHTFYRLKTDKILYKFIFKIFATLGLFQTEGSNDFKTLENYTKKQFKANISTNTTKAITTLENRFRDLTTLHTKTSDELMTLKAERPELVQRNLKLGELESKHHAELQHLNTQLKTSMADLSAQQKQIDTLSILLENTKKEAKASLALKDIDILDLTETIKEYGSSRKLEIENQIQVAKKEKDDLAHGFNQRIQKHEAEIISLTADKTRHTSELNQCHDLIKKLQMEHGDDKGIIQTYIQSLKNKEDEIAGLKQQAKAVTQTITEHTGKITTLTEASKALQNEKTIQDQRVEVLTKQIMDLTKEKNQLLVNNKEFNEKQKLLISELNTKTAELSQLQEQINELNEKIAEFYNVNQELIKENEEFKGLDEDFDTLSKENQQLQDSLDKLTTAHDEKQDDYKNKQERLKIICEDLSRDLRLKTGELAVSQETVKNLTLQVNLLSAEIEELKTSHVPSSPSNTESLTSSTIAQTATNSKIEEFGSPNQSLSPTNSAAPNTPIPNKVKSPRAEKHEKRKREFEARNPKAFEKKSNEKT
jgi:chromosome segregation ATPase